jgi:hypothetical protein
MYGLLEAAEQIRAVGYLRPARGEAETPLRGVRYFIQNKDLEEDWYYSREYWDEYFAMLARNRFNRFNLVYGHNSNYLSSPPYPYLIQLERFPEVGARGQTPEDRERNLDTLRYVSQAAADHGIDFIWGIWQQTVPPDGFHGRDDTITGLTEKNLGPYVREGLRAVLNECPGIRGVQLRVGESGVDQSAREFFRDWVFPAIRETDRDVAVDLRAHGVSQDFVDAAKDAGVRYRFSAKYWAEKLGRPYQPPEVCWPAPVYKYGRLLEKSTDDGTRPYDFFFELWGGCGANRVLLWGDPEYVRRIVPSFRLSGSVGFEIDPPLAQKGYGNAPGRWGIFTPEASDRVFWRYEFERYWLFYQLWGRLSYDASTSESAWTSEAQRRFGGAAQDVLTAYKAASGVIPEIVAAHMPDASMGNWPEVNPGGLLDEYRDTRPSDAHFISSAREAVLNRLHGTASAKQTPFDTASALEHLASVTEQAIDRAARTISPDDPEWLSTESDLRVLSLMARYHSFKKRAAYELTWFDETGDRPSLDAAQQNLQQALSIWERIVDVTDGVYPPQMTFGPFDAGHWKDRLPYARYDLDLIQERVSIADRFGDFDHAFDFAGPISPIVIGPHEPNRDDLAGWQVNVTPRFHHVGPDSLFSENTGHGWETEADRTGVANDPLDYAVLSSRRGDPELPSPDVLFTDFIRGRGEQTFKVQAEDGDYVVHVLHPDRSTTDLRLRAHGGILSVPFPAGDWTVSGLIARRMQPRRPRSAPSPTTLPRPEITHQPPGSVEQGQSVELSVQISGDPSSAVRLHYRSLTGTITQGWGFGHDAEFRTIEQTSANPHFTIPASDVPPGWDLIYYFEILNEERTGWFHPDPATARPYYVLTVGPNASGPIP